MIPILFEHDAMTFEGHGLGDLVDAISCVVKQSDTNEFELEMQYPVTGRLFHELKVNRIIYAQVNNGNIKTFALVTSTISYQAFRIYGFEKTIDGTITVKAAHISYDLAHVYVMPGGLTWGSEDEWWYHDHDAYGPPYGVPFGGGYVSSPNDLLKYFKKENIISGENKFNIVINDSMSSGISNESFTIDEPRSIRSLLFDTDKSLTANFGGICGYNNFTLVFYGSPSNYIAANIDYGDSLIDLTQEENIGELVTGILPFYRGEDARWKVRDNYYGKSDSIVYGEVIRAEGTFERENIIPVDVSGEINSDGLSNGGFSTIQDSVTGKIIDVPNVDEYGRKWFKKNEIGVPEVNITLDYAYLATNVFLGRNIMLYDVIRVRFTKLGIDTTARVTSTTYDVLREQNTEIELGKSKAHGLYYSEYNFGNEYRGKIRY